MRGEVGRAHLLVLSRRLHSDWPDMPIRQRLISASSNDRASSGSPCDTSHRIGRPECPRLRRFTSEEALHDRTSSDCAASVGSKPPTEAPSRWAQDSEPEPPSCFGFTAKGHWPCGECIHFLQGSSRSPGGVADRSCVERDEAGDSIAPALASCPIPLSNSMPPGSPLAR